MTKIVYNGCFGGFDMSEAAVMRYAELSGFALFPEIENSLFTTYWRVPPHERPKTIPIGSYATTPRAEIDAYGAAYRQHVFHPREIKRTDILLVQVVEELGSKASGRFGALRIAEVPSGVRYRIDEYDGNESVMTDNDYEWETA